MKMIIRMYLHILSQCVMGLMRMATSSREDEWNAKHARRADQIGHLLENSKPSMGAIDGCALHL